MNVFGHDYELYITIDDDIVARHHAATGYEGKIPTYLQNPYTEVSTITGGFIDYLTIGNKSLLIRPPLQMVADITYSKKAKGGGDPQTAEIKIYNLTDTTLSKIKKDAIVLLKAGYETDSELSTCFVGTVMKVSTESPKGSDRITTILCKDAGAVNKSVQYVKKFGYNIRITDIFLDMMDAFADAGIPLGAFYGNERSKSYLQESFSFNEPLTTAITKMCNMIKYTWYISCGRLYIQPAEDDRLVDVYQLYPDQVIGALSVQDDKAGKPQSDPTKAEAGVKGKVFFNGNLRLENYIEVMYGDKIGTYAPTKVTYNLNWKEGPWNVTFESQAVKTYTLNQTL